MLLVAAACIGFGDFYAYGAYTERSLILVAVGCALTGAALVMPRFGWGSESAVPHVVVLTLVVWQGLILVRITALYGAGHALSDARYLAIAVPTVAAAAVLAPGRSGDWWWRLLVVAFVVGAVATIRSSPTPRIDVWYLVQHASDCVLRGCNPYTMTTPRSPGVQNGFAYLPMTYVLLAPFRFLVHDVRYGEALAIVVAAILVRRCGHRAARLAPLLLAVPGSFFQIEQAWTESLLVVLLVGAATITWRGRSTTARWVAASILLGLALATKQHIWLLVPVAVLTLGFRVAGAAMLAGLVFVLPWFVVDPTAMWHRTVTDFIYASARADALTLWLHEPAGARTALAVAVLVVAYVLVWLACRGMPHRFLLGSAMVLAGFDLMNKQSFFNQWILVTWLLVAAAAVERQQPVSIVTREV